MPSLLPLLNCGYEFMIQVALNAVKARLMRLAG
jgi:hypothetical protein